VEMHKNCGKIHKRAAIIHTRKREIIMDKKNWDNT
jgi:hypothetical protein